MARLTREEAKAQTRARLLDAAFDVFTAKGFHAATVEEIAEAAGFTRGAFYANFADKADALMVLLERDYETAFGEVGGLVADAADAAKLTAAQHWYERVTARHSLDTAVGEFTPLARSNPEFRRRFAARQAAARRAIATMVTRYCEEAGVELPIPAEEFAAISLAIGEGLSAQRDFDADAVPAELFAKAQLWLWEGAHASGRTTPVGGAADAGLRTKPRRRRSP